MSTLEVIFVVCLAFGVLYTVVTLVFGEILGHWLEGLDLHLFQPFTIVSAITGFGGCGVILSRVTQLKPFSVLLVSAAVGLLLCVSCYFLWVKPMARAESTTTFSIHDLEGSMAEVYTSIPAVGFGEVVITRSSGRANYIAKSFDQTEIPRGSKVVVVKVEGRILSVSLLQL